jgi:hypothetical protein
MLAINYHILSASFSVAREHASHHHEVGASAKGLGDVSRTRAAAIADDEATEAVCCISALHNGR